MIRRQVIIPRILLRFRLRLCPRQLRLCPRQLCLCPRLNYGLGNEYYFTIQPEQVFSVIVQGVFSLFHQLRYKDQHPFDNEFLFYRKKW